MDFLTKFLQRKPPKSGGGSPAASSTPTVPVKPDHEAHVQFAREFVVELVETVPKKSEKAALAKVADKEDIVSLKSVSPSEVSFQSINSVTENTSLPDLLQPESVYKKQTDTDTDTTEYESAAETDPLDATSPIENLIAEDILSDFHEALDKKHSPTEEQKPSSENSVSQASEPSPLSEAYEDVGDTVVKSEAENEANSLDISGLCLFVSNLCLDSPKRSEDTESPDAQRDSVNNSADVNSFVVTEQSFASVSDSTFIDQDKCAEVNESFRDSVSESSQFKVTNQTDFDNFSINLVNEKPENITFSPEKAVELSSLESPAHETALIKQLENTLEITPEVLSPISHEISENTLEATSAKLLEESLVEFSEKTQAAVFSQNTPEVSSEKSVELISKQVEVLSENIPIVTSKFPEAEELLEKTAKTLLFNVTEKSGETREQATVKSIELTSDVHDISPTKLIQIIPVETLDATVEASDVSSVKPSAESPENTSEVKTKEILELLDSLVEQTNLSTKEPSEELPVKPLETPIEATDIILKSFEESPVKLDEILEKSIEAASVIPTEVTEENVEVSEVKFTETKPETTEVSNESFPRELKVPAEKFPEILSKTLTGESLTIIRSPVGLPAEQIESRNSSEVTPVKSTEKTSEVTKLKHDNETKISEVTVKQESSVVLENIPVQETEVEADTREKADPVREWASETDICSSESIPVEETPSVASATNSIEEKLLESKDFSTSFEVLSIDKEVTSEIVEDKICIESDESDKELSQNQLLVKILNPSAELGAGDYKLQQSEKEVSFEKKAPTVLTELFEICNRQQKDLELGDGKFVDGREFFDTPSISTNLNETVVINSAQPDLSKTVKGENYGDFDKSITEEAEKVYQEILNASSHLNDSSVNSSDSTVQQNPKMADVRGVSNSATTIADDVMNPFATQSSLRRSPPPSAKPSPRSSSQGPSPADSPHMRSKPSSVNPVRDNSLPRDGTGDASPRSRSGKNSPDCRISSNKLSSLEGSPKNSIISSEINQSEAGPEIADDGNVQSGDVFKDPSAFDFLNSVGNSNITTDLRKESLYVKFDPLVGGGARTVDQCVPLPPAFETKSNNFGPPASSSPHESFSNNVTPPRNVAISVVDKLISLSPSPRKQEVETPIKQVITPVSTPVKEIYPDNSSMLEELYLLREILAKQDEKHREEIVMEQQKLDHLQAQLKEYEERETRLNKKVAEKSQGQKQMSIIMEEYEKTISRLVAEKEQERQAHELDRASLLKERDTAMGHLANIEIAFSDLHKKYERSKTVIEGFKKNEEVLRASLAEYEATIRKQEQKYDVLKSHAMAQLENANQELDSVKRSQQAEAAKLKAMLKKAEIKTSSLEEMLEQKVKENQELASICDELINKVGNSE